jgi:hypothetical protein
MSLPGVKYVERVGDVPQLVYCLEPLLCHLHITRHSSGQVSTV